MQVIIVQHSPTDNKIVAMMILMRIVVQNFLYVSQPVTGLVSSKCL